MSLDGNTMQKRVLVTGGAGFVGSHLVDALLALGHSVAVIDNLSSGKRTNVDPRATFFEQSIDHEGVDGYFDSFRPDVVFHLAAQKSVSASIADPKYDAHINIHGSLHLLENCVRTGVEKFIFASSGGAIYSETSELPATEDAQESPATPYGVAKLAVDKYLATYARNHRLSYVSFRPANIYGPRQDPEGEAGVVAVFLSLLLSGRTPTINGSGEQTRDFVYVGDIIRAFLLGLDERAGGTYNLGTGEETSILDLYRAMLEAGGFDADERLGPPRDGDQKRSSISPEKIQQELGWRPVVDLRQGLRNTIQWFQDHHQVS